jgi:hypothetical protein
MGKPIAMFHRDQLVPNDIEVWDVLDGPLLGGLQSAARRALTRWQRPARSGRRRRVGVLVLPQERETAAGEPPPPVVVTVYACLLPEERQPEARGLLIGERPVLMWFECDDERNRSTTSCDDRPRGLA